LAHDLNIEAGRKLDSNVVQKSKLLWCMEFHPPTQQSERVIMWGQWKMTSVC